MAGKPALIVEETVAYIGINFVIKVGGLMASAECELVSWSLTSLFSTNMAISETNGHSL